MPRRLIVLNAALIVIALIAAGYVVRELRAPAPAPRGARRAAPAAAAATGVAPAGAETTPGAYNVVAARNLFSPTRSEAPISPIAGGPPTAKPNLYGISLSDGNSVAYLEDPITKRVAGYRLGDIVAGGTLKQISADSVVLNRPDGDLNVRLRDPAKPRVAAGGPPGPPGVSLPALPGVPSVAPPGVHTMPPMTFPPPPASGLAPPTSGPPVLPRRPLPPSLSRRLPATGTDAPTQ